MSDRVSFLDLLSDRYALVRELGRGGMATVYLVRDLRHKRDVALKVLDPEVGAAVGPARFLREIDTAARLQHPHILPVFDSGESKGRLWYTMPYVAGDSLRERLRRETRLEIAEAVRLAREIAEALEAAHGADVVHRDIKPENVLLSHGHALVADFGIARTGAASGSHSLTETGFSVGTPTYMSPEQALGERTIDGRSDIYSLGCLTFELLTGLTPYLAESGQAMIAAHLTQPVPDIRARRPEVPPEVAGAVRRALAKSPGERFATAGDFARALIAVQEPTVTTASVAARPARVTPRTAILAMAATIIAVGGLWGVRHARSSVNETTRLAVLPFDNLGDTADAYFAAGLAGELRGRLAAVHGLEVIGSTSSSGFRRGVDTPRDVARALGVRYVLVGQVQWSHQAGGGGSLRVRPELVDGRTGATAWGQAFDGSARDLFQVQADIAGRVVDALGIALGKSARVSLSSSPTGSARAYDAYLRAHTAFEEFANLGETDRITQLRRYAEEAVAQDSMFGPAWAMLSTAQSWTAHPGCVRCPSADSARTAAERAVRLAPKRPEGYAALARYWIYVAEDPERGFEAAQAGLRELPNDPDLLGTAAWQLGILGQWDRALEFASRAEAVDPRSLAALQAHARLLVYLHRYDELRALCRRGLTIAPRYTHFIAWQMIASLMQGDSAGARAVFEEGSPGLDVATLTNGLVNLFQEDLVWAMPAAAKALITSQPTPPGAEDRISLHQVRAALRLWQGDTSGSRFSGDSALSEFEPIFPDSTRDPLVWAWNAQVAAYAGQRSKAEAALVHARRSRAHSDAFFDPVREEAMALAYTRIGDPEQALDVLEDLVRHPYWITPAWLRISPAYASLRKNSRFERLTHSR